MTNNLLFSDVNHVESAALASTPASVTSLELIKNSFAARRTKFTNLSSLINIAGDMAELSEASFFAMAGHNLKPEARVRFLLRASDNSIVYDSAFIPVGEREVFYIPFGQTHTFSAFQVVIDHGYNYTPPTTTTTQAPPVVTTTTVPDGIYRQGSDGTLSLEAENGDFSDSGTDNFIVNNETGASNDQYVDKSENTFYSNSSDGPRTSFEFTASRSGSHDVYLRVRSSFGKNSMYMIFDGSSRATIMPTTYSNWTWHKLPSVTLTAERRHNIAIAARDRQIEIDKIVLLPAGSPIPNNAGPAESDEGTTTTTTVTQGGVTTVIEAGSSDSVELRMMLLGTVFELENNFSIGASSGDLTAPENRRTHSGRSVQARAQRQTRNMSLSVPRMYETDRDRLRQFQIQRAGKPFLVNAYPGSDDYHRDRHIMLARFSNTLEFTQQSELIYSTAFDLEEV